MRLASPRLAPEPAAGGAQGLGYDHWSWDTAMRDDQPPPDNG
eukprot:SAG11_NODE_25976_length_351_cov_0.916667_1_plen_41_part_01